MTKSAHAPDSEDWDKKFAPRIGKKRLIASCFLYFGWIAFLAVLAAQRWYGSLQ